MLLLSTFFDDYKRAEFFTVVEIHIVAFWIMIACSLASEYDSEEHIASVFCLSKFAARVPEYMMS
jgi:predicted acetyltransferase